VFAVFLYRGKARVGAMMAVRCAHPRVWRRAARTSKNEQGCQIKLHRILGQDRLQVAQEPWEESRWFAGEGFIFKAMVQIPAKNDIGITMCLLRIVQRAMELEWLVSSSTWHRRREPLSFEAERRKEGTTQRAPHDNHTSSSRLLNHLKTRAVRVRTRRLEVSNCKPQ
jgi:hypothetical protein